MKRYLRSPLNYRGIVCFQCATSILLVHTPIQNAFNVLSSDFEVVTVADSGFEQNTNAEGELGCNIID
jgi:hypothetical protein